MIFTLEQYMGDDTTILHLAALPGKREVQLVYRNDREASIFAQPVMDECRYLSRDDAMAVRNTIHVTPQVLSHIVMRLRFHGEEKDSNLIAALSSIGARVGNSRNEMEGFIIVGLDELWQLRLHGLNVDWIGKYVAPCSWMVLLGTTELGKDSGNGQAS